MAGHRKYTSTTSISDWVEPVYNLDAAEARLTARELRDPKFKATNDAAKVKIAELKEKTK